MMKTLVVYESMYGNTRQIAEAIANGLQSVSTVAVQRVADVAPDDCADADLIVSGGPTHAHGLSRASTRHAAIEAGEKPGSGLVVEPDAEALGLRDWIAGLPQMDGRTVAVFDTRMAARAFLTGRASRGLAKKLRRKGCTVLVPPESFLVDKKSRLFPGELERARKWGAAIALRAFVDGPRTARAPR